MGQIDQIMNTFWLTAKWNVWIHSLTWELSSRRTMAVQAIARQLPARLLKLLGPSDLSFATKSQGNCGLHHAVLYYLFLYSVHLFDTNLLEFVQWRFNKRIWALQNLSNQERLQHVSALSLHNYRTYADMVTVLFKSLHNGMVVDLGLLCTTSNTKGGGVRLQQWCSKSCTAALLFSYRVPPIRNKLPLTVATSPSLMVLNDY